MSQPYIVYRIPTGKRRRDRDSDMVTSIVSLAGEETNIRVASGLVKGVALPETTVEVYTPVIEAATVVSIVVLLPDGEGDERDYPADAGIVTSVADVSLSVAILTYVSENAVTTSISQISSADTYGSVAGTNYIDAGTLTAVASISATVIHTTPNDTATITSLSTVTAGGVTTYVSESTVVIGIANLIPVERMVFIDPAPNLTTIVTSVSSIVTVVEAVAWNPDAITVLSSGVALAAVGDVAAYIDTQTITSTAVVSGPDNQAFAADADTITGIAGIVTTSELGPVRVSPPAATASTSAPAPLIPSQPVSPLAATATASAPVPAINLKVTPAQATATASAPAVSPQISLFPPLSTATIGSPPIYDTMVMTADVLNALDGQDSTWCRANLNQATTYIKDNTSINAAYTLVTRYHKVSSYAQLYWDINGSTPPGMSPTNFPLSARHTWTAGDWMLLDQEQWATATASDSSTPCNEQNDPATYIAAAISLAQANGVYVIATPARTLASSGMVGDATWTPDCTGTNPIHYQNEPGFSGESLDAAFLRIGIPEAAAAADIAHVQAQADEATTATYQSFVTSWCSKVRAVSRARKVTAGLSWGLTQGTPTAAQCKADADAVAGLISGFWLNCASADSTAVATCLAFLKLLWVSSPPISPPSYPIPAMQLTVPSNAATASASSIAPSATGGLTLANTFEGGSDGTTITTGNSGGTSGDAFDFTSGTVPIFSTAHAMHGTVGLAMQGDGNVRWSSTIVTGGNTTMYGRVYVFITAAPNVQAMLVGGQTPTNTNVPQFIVRINTTRKIGLLTKSGTAVASTTSLTTATWYRLEFRMVTVASGTCTTDCNIYVGDSTTLTEAITQSTGTGGVNDTAINGFIIGSTNIITANVVFLDDIQVNSTGYPGPS